jgi:predicted site-specific integrase-resolvase
MENQVMEAKFANAGQAARLIGVHRATIGRWARSARIMAVKLPDGSYVVPMAEVERIRAERELQR